MRPSGDQRYWVPHQPYAPPGEGGLEAATADPCADRGPDRDWPVGDPEVGWHLDDQHSGLKAARDRVAAAGRPVRVGILDTGYDPDHVSRPRFVRTDLERNFYDEDSPMFTAAQTMAIGPQSPVFISFQ